MTEKELNEAIIDAGDNNRYSEVLELASQTNYKNEPVDARVAYYICDALFYTNDNEDNAFKLANLFLNFYGNCPQQVQFELIIGVYWEYKSKYSTALTWVSESVYPKTYKRIADKLQKKENEIASRNELLKSYVSEYSQLSSVKSILESNGIETIKDLSETSNSRIDSFANMGPAKMQIIKDFKTEYNL
jgi:hypothetical protein